MAGHSKWKNIQHRKGAQDARRGKMFTKLAKEIYVAARLGGDDLDGNPRLRAAVTKAKSVSMPKDNIDRAIKKGVGGGEGADYVEKVYEGYGPGGVAVIVECLTDNINRTVADVRYAFTRTGGNLGQDGSVNWMFKKKGEIVYQRSKIKDFDALLEVALENGALDVDDSEAEVYEISCEPAAFNDLKEALDKKLGVEADAAEVNLIPDNYTTLDEEKSASLTKLINLLEDNDDVQNVYHNGELFDE
jgi:YebC/PmpR family DNA-binding regulatory protein